MDALKKAIQAYDDGNWSISESLCDAILLEANSCYQAWLIKGKAVGWQSLEGPIRIKEAIRCFEKAIFYGPVDGIFDMKEGLPLVLGHIWLSMISACCIKFAQSGHVEDAACVLEVISQTQPDVSNFMTLCDMDPETYKASIAVELHYAVQQAYDNPISVRDEFFEARSLACIQLLNEALRMKAPNSKSNCHIYEDMIFILSQLLEGADNEALNIYKKQMLEYEAHIKAL